MQIAYSARTASCRSARSSICNTAADEPLKLQRKTTSIKHIFAITSDRWNKLDTTRACSIYVV